MADRTKVGEICYDVTLDTGKLVDGQRTVSREVEKAAQSFNLITAAIKIYAAAMTMVKAAQLADEFRMLQARVEVAAGSLESGTVAMRELVAISQRTQTSIEANASVFARLNQSLVQMGGTQQDTLVVTELLSKAIKVSGANAVEAKAAMLQFGQALGSGRLQGDEFRSLMENAPYLMRQLADSIGVPIGALKQLSSDGQLTSDVIVNALTKASARINEDFSKFPVTFEAAVQAMTDAAGRANLKLDELTGKSTVFTGAAKGVAEVLDKLAEELGALNEQAGALGRNQAVKDWADSTRVALSYVLDGADALWQTLSVLGRNVAFVFTGIGTEIGGIGAQVAAVMRGDFAGARAIGEAMQADAEKRRKDLDEADAKTLARTKLLGQQMREAWEQGAGGGRGFVNPQAAPSVLKPPRSVANKGAQFDADAYIAGLAQKVASEWDKVGLIETEALRKNKQMLADGKITRQQYESAVTLITQASAQERLDIQLRHAEDMRRAIEEGGKQEIEEAKKRAEGQKAALEAINGANPIAQLQAELEAKSALLAQYALQDQANLELYAQARVALEQETNQKIAEIIQKHRDQQLQQQSQMLTNYGSLFGSMADLTKAFGNKQSATYRTLFAISKAFAIADSLVHISAGLARASDGPFPENLAAMATVAAATANIVSTIQGVQFGGGKLYGGPTAANTLYRVNEGGRPEMWKGPGGQQYMMSSTPGSVVPADQVGAGGGAVQVLVQVSNNHPTAQVTASTDDTGRIVQIAVAEIAGQFAANSGAAWNALRGASNVQGRIS